MEQEKIDYGKTLNLPKTDFPMRGNLPQKEPEILKFWEENDIYHLVEKENEGKPKFILHDGLPYANGDIHLGHTLNKILKDIIVKQKSQVGFDAPYVPGWDTHGLPIELRAIKDMGLNENTEDKVAFRKRCADYALKYVNLQQEEFKRLGVRADWEHRYVTLDPKFEAEQIKVFGEMAKKGYIYKGVKPVHWCPSCGTALAEAEIEYAELRSPSVYVKFPVIDSKGLFDTANTYFVIWTTTPWTLPANVAISLHPDFTYIIAQFGDEKYIMAKDMMAMICEETGLPTDYKIVAEFKGSDLEYCRCKHPFMERESLVINGDHVTLDAGTGCVHTAPGHGDVDFVVGQRYKLPILSPMDDKGCLTSDAGIFAGLSADDANKAICQWLDENKYLIKLKFIKHQYPHCWRCKNPTLFRSTAQWFASIDGFRQNALDEINRVKFIPSWGHDRIYNMIADRGDWCISRQRTWGVPIPIFYCEECGAEIVNDQTIEHISNLFREHGSDIWFAKDAMELIPDGLTCPKCGGKHFRKETDIMDVWFDSGSSHYAVLNNWPNLRWPADLYLEGSDQHRGWFNSSLCTSVAMFGRAPYDQVLTHGFIVDEQGRKMSKSLGNGVDPLEVIKTRGADILRLWVASSDYRNDIAVSENIMKQVSEAYRKIRNTFRYLLGSIYDFDVTNDRVQLKDMKELDRWAEMKLQQLIQKITKAYEEYEYHVIYQAVHNFCIVDMSAFYLDIIKDRLYSTTPTSVERRSAQTVLYDIAVSLVQMLAPIIPFTCEEVWKYLPVPEKKLSVQLSGWPTVNEEAIDPALEEKWNKILAIRSEASKALEEARRNKTIGHSLDAAVAIYAEGENKALLNEKAADLANILIVSQAYVADFADAPSDCYKNDELKLAVKVGAAKGVKCERCWIYSEEIGQDSHYPTLCPRCAKVLEEENFSK